MALLEPPQPRSLADIAQAIGADCVGDSAFVVSAVAHPMLAESEDTLALAMDGGSYRALGQTKAAAAVVAEGQDIDTERFRGGLVAGRERFTLARLLDLFPRPVHAESGVHPSAVVDETAKLGEGVAVGPFSYVGPRARIGAGSVILSHAAIGADAVLGEGCLIHPGAKVGDRCVLGARCILQPGAVVGGDGFGYATPNEGSVEEAKRTHGEITSFNTEIVRINSIGNVVIGDDVEIGANACVDRGTLGPTRVGDGTKIDNLVQIGHNVTIGGNCLIAGQVAIGGSVKIGDRVVIGGNAGLADHLTIGDDAVIAGMSGMIADAESRKLYAGYPARPWKETVALQMDQLRIGRLVNEVRKLARRMDKMDRGNDTQRR